MGAAAAFGGEPRAPRRADVVAYLNSLDTKTH